MSKRGHEQIKTCAQSGARSAKRRVKNQVASGMPLTNHVDDDSELGRELDSIANYADDYCWPENLRYWLA